MYKLKASFMLGITKDNHDYLATLNFLENNGFQYLVKKFIDEGAHIGLDDYLHIYIKDNSLKDLENISDKVPFGIDPGIKSLMKTYSDKLFLKKDHIHVYIEGYYDKWAFPLHEIIDYDFSSKNERINYKNKMLLFLNYCNIKYKGTIDVPLSL